MNIFGFKQMQWKTPRYGFEVGFQQFYGCCRVISWQCRERIMGGWTRFETTCSAAGI